VVEINRRDDGDFRRHDICGIQAPAHSRFINRKINFEVGESNKGQRRYAFEKRGMCCELAGSHQRFDASAHASPYARENFVGDIFAVDADAFVDHLQMRRSVESGAQTGRAKN